MGFIDIANEKFAGVRQHTADFLTVQKLNARLRSLRRELERVYAAIGEVCCRIHAEGGDDASLEPMFEKAASLREELALVTAETDRLNRIVRCTGCGETVSRTLNYCPKCGAKLEHTEN